MSNETLVARLEVALACVRDGNMAACELAQIVRANGAGLEAMPYPLILEMRGIVMDLDIAQWYDEDGCLPDLNKVLNQAEAWVAKLPRSA